MTDIDFYVDVVCRENVLGVGVGGSLDSFAAALGDDCVDDERKGRLRRDYGILEAFFERTSGAWRCVGLTVQIHRLRHSEEGLVPEPLRQRYGSFSEGVAWSALKQRIEAGGCLVVLDQRGYTGEFRRFLVNPSGVTVVARKPDPPASEEEQSLLWAIEVS
jgi:hypothetical protein